LYESALSDYRADWQVQALQEYEHLMTCNEHEDFESVPFTQATLADLLGYRLSLAEYEYYFDNFLEAQRKRLPTLEHYRKEFLAVLPKLYPEFRKVALASDIVEVRSYRRRIKAGAPIIKLTTRQAQESESPQSPRRWTRSTTQQSQDSDSPQPPRRLIRLLRENSLGRLFKANKTNRQNDYRVKLKRKFDYTVALLRSRWECVHRHWSIPSEIALVASRGEHGR
jgi:hypothetical protein